MNKKKRIVVTGLGVVSCFGNDKDVFFNALLEGKSGVSTITSFPIDDFPTKFAAEIKNFDPADYIDKKQARRVDKYIAYTFVAAKKALESSNLYPEGYKNLDPKKGGIIIGSGMGGMQVYNDGVLTLHEKGWKKVTPFFVPFIITNMGGGLLAMDLGWMGPNYSISTACATGNNSIIAAADYIRAGKADYMLCGGAEAPILPMGLAGFCACKALSQRNDEPTKASRPWDKNRDGFVMGEGSGVLLLESLEHAQARNAPIYAEYLGGGVSCDAYHMTEPRSDGEGVKQCIINALEDAGITPQQVDYINAHATSTPAGDMAEINAISKVFDNTKKIVINAPKSLIGHGLGAAGGLEAVDTVMQLNSGMFHGTINLDDPEPLDFIVPKKAEKFDCEIGISNSFGFGGHNATIVFKKYKE
ncbi:3-oxoacyl-[acyl-carrier-protein] synthase 2 [Candidatus Rubidus massiliensis]|nr:3-oxoacyl-[acyl-carrier-protein] synthase 2 [Candidatus Rubidus massiliensis]